jgi:hypothetical protein
MSNGVAIGALIVAVVTLLLFIGLIIWYCVDRGNLVNVLNYQTAAVTFTAGSSTATANYAGSLAGKCIALTGTTQGSTTVTISLSLTNNSQNKKGSIFYITNELVVGSGTPPSRIDLQLSPSGSLTVNPSNLSIPYFGSNSSTTGGAGGYGRTAMFMFSADNVAQFMGMTTSGLSG